MKQDRFGKELRCALKPGLFVLACLHAYSSSFLMSSQDPTVAAKPRPRVFFMHGLGDSACSSCRYIYVPNYGDDVGRPGSEVCDLCR